MKQRVWYCGVDSLRQTLMRLQRIEIAFRLCRFHPQHLCWQVALHYFQSFLKVVMGFDSLILDRRRLDATSAFFKGDIRWGCKVHVWELCSKYQPAAICVWQLQVEKRAALETSFELVGILSFKVSFVRRVMPLSGRKEGRKILRESIFHRTLWEKMSLMCRGGGRFLAFN